MDHDSSSSDDNPFEHMGQGNRHGQAILDIKKFERRIRKKPREITRKFESRARHEMGVIPGMPWTLAAWIKSWRWGPHQGLIRGAIMDVAVYEWISQGLYAQAQAQLVQNIKCKQQAAISNGNFTTAWLFTGLAEPVGKPKFVGEGPEMATLAAYITAESEIDKRTAVRNWTAPADGEETPWSHPMLASAKKKAAKKAAVAAAEAAKLK